MTDNRDRIDDPKLIFYLQRREQIDEWAKLVELEKAAAISFLRSLIGDLEAAARDLEPEIVIENRLLDGEETVALFRPSWLSSPSDGPVPRALIAIAWWKSVRFSIPANAPWVGLRIGSSRDRALRRTLGVMVSEQNLGRQLFPSGTASGSGAWVRFRTVPATGARFWEDLAPYRSELVTSVLDGWRTFADVIESAVTSTPSDAGTKAEREEQAP